VGQNVALAALVEHTIEHIFSRLRFGLIRSMSVMAGYVNHLHSVRTKPFPFKAGYFRFASDSGGILDADGS
jgi:hypothetical protein